MNLLKQTKIILILSCLADGQILETLIYAITNFMITNKLFDCFQMNFILNIYSEIYFVKHRYIFSQCFLFLKQLRQILKIGNRLLFKFRWSV